MSDSRLLSKSAKVKAGDLLWMVERRGNAVHGSEVEVTKVGRRWAQIAKTGAHRRDCGRIDLADLTIDGGDYASPGRCFRSRAEYEKRLRLAEAWDDLRKQVNGTYRRPDHLSLADMQAIRALLSPTPQEPPHAGE